MVDKGELKKLFINNNLFYKKFLKSLDIAKVFWSKIDFSVILAKNRIFENNAFPVFFIISQILYPTPKSNPGLG
jgi:hypothetical protein